MANGPTFSAFTHAGSLYVTILGDCNAVSGKLVVDNFCKADRLTKNFALECDVTLRVMQNQMACDPSSVEAKVVSFDLDRSNVAHEAQLLNLEYNGNTIKVEINR